MERSPSQQGPTTDIQILQRSHIDETCQKVVPSKRMAPKIPPKKVDDIKTMKEMMELCELLNVAYDQEDPNLKEMKKEAKKMIEEQSLNGTTGFSIISKTKEEDISKRNKLEKIYSEVHKCLEQMDEDVIAVLNTHFYNRNILEILHEKRDQLKKRVYNILIAGESSAGKSSLLNLILGEELLPHHVLHATSTICELRYGEEKKLIVHYKYNRDQRGKPSPQSVLLQTKEECGKTYQEQIYPYINLEENERETGSEYEKVELLWPHELLQEGVVLIDSPGLGESEDMDQVLMNYLPNAFAFIYVIDVSHAGGVQQDLKVKLMKIVEKVQSLEGGTENCKNLAECSIFVANKWDQVKKPEQDKTKKYLAKRLNECWQDANLANHILYMSVLKATEAQQYGGVTTEFNNLLESIKEMILRTINTKLYNHWKWLDLALYLISKLTFFYTRKVESSQQNMNAQINAIEIRLVKIEKQKEEVTKEVEEKLAKQSAFLSSVLDSYIHSPEFEKKFTTWDACLVPMNKNTWEETKISIMEVIEYRFKELLIEWEKENKICAEMHKELVEEFLTRLNLLEEELQEMHDTEKQIDHLSNKSPLTMPAKILVGATSPVWIPVGVVSLIIGIPVLGVMALKSKVSKKVKPGKYAKDPRVYLEKRSKKFLASLTKDDASRYAKWLTEKTAEVLRNFADYIPTLIEANRRMVSQLRCDARNHVKIMEHYTPIRKESSETRKNMLKLGIKLCPATVDARDLDWKEDTDSFVGEGEFSRVYRGTLKNGGRNKKLDANYSFDVAVKVFKKQFDDINLRLYLNEELMIRHLDHKSIAKFFGAKKVDVSYQSSEHKFLFVRQFCKENLRSVIFNDESKTPAKASNTGQAIVAFLKWAIEIADGLMYIHGKRLIHRHLKLENILMNEDGTAMITDIGMVGQFLETEKSIIYLAPEVLANLNMRTKEADIYSYGIVLWEMWYGIQAFTELMPLNKTTFQDNIALYGHCPINPGKTISLPEVQAIMECCWTNLATERFRAEECYDKFQVILQGFNVTANTSDEF